MELDIDLFSSSQVMRDGDKDEGDAANVLFLPCAKQGGGRAGFPLAMYHFAL